jgi:hypothetical protein
MTGASLYNPGMANHVEGLFARLQELRAAIEVERKRHQEAERPLLTERDEILRALEREGLSLRQLGDAAGLRSADSVRKALRRQR